MVSPSKKRKGKQSIKNDNTSEKLTARASKNAGVQQVPIGKPLRHKKFYLDLKNYRGRTSLVEDLKTFGAAVDDFLSKEVTYVITDRVDWNINSSGAGTSGSPSPSLLTNLGFGVESPVTLESTGEGPEKKRIKTRAEAMLERATCQKKGTSDVLENARRWGVDVWPLAKVLKWLEKLKRTQPVKKERSSQVLKTQSSSQPRKLLHPFIKFEAFNRQYKPSYKELSVWPNICLETRAGTYPFQEPAKQREITRAAGKGKGLGTAESDDERERMLTKMTRRTHLRSQNAQIETGHLNPKRPGYCEICCVSYLDLAKHIKCDSHQKFIHDDQNFLSLDLLISQGPNIDQFLRMNGTKDLSAVNSSQPSSVRRSPRSARLQHSLSVDMVHLPHSIETRSRAADCHSHCTSKKNSLTGDIFTRKSSPHLSPEEKQVRSIGRRESSDVIIQIGETLESKPPKQIKPSTQAINIGEDHRNAIEENGIANEAVTARGLRAARRLASSEIENVLDVLNCTDGAKGTKARCNRQISSISEEASRDSFVSRMTRGTLRFERCKSENGSVLTDVKDAKNFVSLTGKNSCGMERKSPELNVDIILKPNDKTLKPEPKKVNSTHEISDNITVKPNGASQISNSEHVGCDQNNKKKRRKSLDALFLKDSSTYYKMEVLNWRLRSSNAFLSRRRSTSDKEEVCALVEESKENKEHAETSHHFNSGLQCNSFSNEQGNNIRVGCRKRHHRTELDMLNVGDSENHLQRGRLRSGSLSNLELRREKCDTATSKTGENEECGLNCCISNNKVSQVSEKCKKDESVSDSDNSIEGLRMRRKSVSRDALFLKDNKDYYKFEIFSSKLRSTKRYCNSLSLSRRDALSASDVETMKESKSDDDIVSDVYASESDSGKGVKANEKDKCPCESRKKARRRTYAEVFLHDNLDYYKFEISESRLRTNKKYPHPYDPKAASVFSSSDSNSEEKNNKEIGEESAGARKVVAEKSVFAAKERVEKSVVAAKECIEKSIVAAKECIEKSVVAAKESIGERVMASKDNVEKSVGVSKDSGEKGEIHYKHKDQGKQEEADLSVNIKPFSLATLKKFKLPKVTGEPPENINEMYFSFETVPESEPWYQTYQRQDEGEEFRPYVSEHDRHKPFLLPYEMPIENLLLNDEEKKKTRLKKSIRLPHLDETPRKSPRCHASTRAILSGILPRRYRRTAVRSPLKSDSSGEKGNKVNSSTLNGNSCDLCDSGDFKSETDEELQEIARNLEGMLHDMDEDAELIESSIFKMPEKCVKGKGKKKGKRRMKLPQPVRVDDSTKMDRVIHGNIDPIIYDGVIDGEGETGNIPCAGVNETSNQEFLTLMDECMQCECMEKVTCEVERGNSQEESSTAESSSECTSTCDTLSEVDLAPGRKKRGKKRKPNLTGWPNPKRKKKSIFVHSQTLTQMERHRRSVLHLCPGLDVPVKHPGRPHLRGKSESDAFHTCTHQGFETTKNLSPRIISAESTVHTLNSKRNYSQSGWVRGKSQSREADGESELSTEIKKRESPRRKSQIILKMDYLPMRRRK